MFPVAVQIAVVCDI